MSSVGGVKENAVNGLVMSRELAAAYEEKRAALSRERSSLEADIRDLKNRLAKMPRAFFESTVLPKWNADLAAVNKKIKEVDTYLDTIAVFTGENAQLLASASVDRDVVLGNKPPPDYDEFWLGVDKFIAAHNASHSQARNEKAKQMAHASLQGGDLEWDV